MAGKLGLLAGKGNLPRRIIEACKKQGREIFVIAFKDQTDNCFLGDVDHAWVRLGAAGQSVKLLHEHGVDTLVMAGPIHRPSMPALRPDAWSLKFFAKAGRKAFGDDGLLSALITTLEAEEGFKVIGIDEILGDFVAQAGLMTATAPDDEAKGDIAQGYRIAKAIGALDVGQGCVVQQGLVLGVEAIEGTQKLLERCKSVSRFETPKGVLVKCKKPNQEERADLPTIGVDTVEQVKAAGLQGIAIEAHSALIVDPDAVIERANRYGLFVIGITDNDFGSPS